MKHNIEEDAISPVIGVILMIAIVVILAATVAAFTFGMAGSTGTSKIVGLTVNPDGITWQGGSDLSSIRMFNATIDGVDICNGTSAAVGQTDAWWNTSTDVSGERVIIVAQFDDGASQVIFDRVM